MMMLDTFLDARRALPFAWGAHDCCTFGADWVRELSGEDAMDGLRCTDARRAYRRIAELGGLALAVPAQLDRCWIRWRDGHASVPARGALVLLHTARGAQRRQSRPQARRYAGQALGVSTGTHVALPAAQGLMFLRLPSAQVLRSWELLP